MTAKNPLRKEAEAVIKAMGKATRIKALSRFAVTKKQFNALCSLPDTHSKTTTTAVAKGFNIYCIENSDGI